MKMRHFQKCHCLLPEAKRRVQPGCAVEVESMAGHMLCDFFATKDLVESMKGCEQMISLQQQKNLVRQSFAIAIEKVCLPKSAAFSVDASRRSRR